MKLNDNFLLLKRNYLFSEVAKKTAAYQRANPNTRLLRLSIGDVTRPLAPAVIAAMKRAADEMGDRETFKGYAPDATHYGYEALLSGIVQSYARKGVEIGQEEIFISDGAKSDLGNLSDLFSANNTVLLPDPVYPAYLDTNIIAGRKILCMDGNEENGFLPVPDKKIRADIIYLCSPNNPTGAAYSRDRLAEWVCYARDHRAVILYDAAYEAYISDPDLPRSIYEIGGAKKCAIEICSFSKSAGFTGVRCGFCVVPTEIEGGALHRLWERRQSVKFNGVSYITQMGAAAVFTQEGALQTANAIGYYKENAKLLCGCLASLGIWHTGGKNSPYVWMECPGGMTSEQFFEYLLEKANIVGTPGSGFGKNGEGFFRLTAFGTREDTLLACERLKKYL